MTDCQPWGDLPPKIQRQIRKRPCDMRTAVHGQRGSAIRPFTSDTAATSRTMANGKPVETAIA